MRANLARRPWLREAAFLLLLGGCSVVPATGLPPEHEGRVEVVYDFGGDGPVPVAVPESSRELTVLELTADPPQAEERFIDGRRYLVAPPGTHELRIACRYRVYGQRGARRPFAHAPRIQDAFPGARVVGGDTQD